MKIRKLLLISLLAFSMFPLAAGANPVQDSDTKLTH